MTRYELLRDPGRQPRDAQVVCRLRTEPRRAAPPGTISVDQSVHDPPNHTLHASSAQAFTADGARCHRPRVSSRPRLLAPAWSHRRRKQSPGRFRTHHLDMLVLPWTTRLEPEWITMIVCWPFHPRPETTCHARDALAVITPSPRFDRDHPPAAADALCRTDAAEEERPPSTNELFALSSLLVACPRPRLNLIATRSTACPFRSLARLPADPRTDAKRGREFLRFGRPRSSRRVRDTVHRRGGSRSSRQTIYLFLVRANHDEVVGSTGRTRHPSGELQHMAFGYGIHHCLGAPLARLETAVAVQALVELPGLELVGSEPQWGGAAALSQRGLQHLHISWDHRLA